MINSYKNFLKKQLAQGLKKVLTKVEPEFHPQKQYPVLTVSQATNLATYKTRPMKADETLLTKAVSFPNSHYHSRELFEAFSKRQEFKKMLEIGASYSSNSKDLFPELEYLNLDIAENSELPTVVGDITEKTSLESESFDLIVSHQTFEHINQPWLAAQEIVRLLKPGGLCYISTHWAWRYHPVPIDYWRFSPDCLAFLFEGLDQIDGNFNIYHRRTDIRGLWPNEIDAVPVDDLGGWRENWFVYYLGMKPETISSQ